MRKEQLLSSITSRISYFGIAKTTIEDIAAGAGVSVAALYYYFPGKDAAVLAALASPTAEYFKTLTEKIARRSLSMNKALNLALRSRMKFLRNYCWFDYLHPASINSASPDILCFRNYFIKEERLAFVQLLSKDHDLTIRRGNQYTALASEFISGIDGLATCNCTADASDILKRQQLFAEEFLNRNPE